MSRETTTLTTPSGISVEVHTYLTGREYEYMQTPLLEAMSVKPDSTGSDVSFGNLDVNKIQEATHRLVEKMVVSVGGSSENVLDAVMDLKNEDYQFVIESLNDLTKKN